MWKRTLLCVLCLSFVSPFLIAEEESSAVVQDDYHYFAIEPDIISNYVKPGSRIGFMRLTVELMTNSKINIALLEKNEPLIRDKIMTILGEQTEESVKSISKREGIRLRCLDEVNAVLYDETGKKPVTDLFFTKYLYQ
ncbi:MAG: flagellar basal body-associated FliL family protein [Psychromonas sp.]